MLVYSFRAYRQTRLTAFALWIWSSSLGLVMLVLNHAYLTQRGLPAEQVRQVLIFVRALYIINAVLGSVAAIMLINHILAKLPPAAPVDIPA